MTTPRGSGGRVIAVGDIHGCSTALAALMRVIHPAPDDVVVVLGDVIDYGPDSRGVLKQLRELGTRTRLVLLTGNHEVMLLGVLDDGRDPETWTRHGGDRTLTSYGVNQPGELPSEHVALLRAGRPFFETDTHLFVHAGYYPNLPLGETPAVALFWESLEPERVRPHCSGKTVVVGHTPQTTGEVLDLGFVVGIDTDCSRGGWLTAFDTASGRIWQANESAEFRGGSVGRPRRQDA